MTVVLVAGSGNLPLAQDISSTLGVRLTPMTLERFADGEVHVVIEQTVRGQDVYVLQPTSPPVDEHLIELLFIGDACRRAGAARVTAVIPYFGYARQDRRARGREPVGARVVASLIESVGFARVVAIDLHSPAIEGFFRIPIEHLSASAALAASVPVEADTVIVAPDLGAVKLAEQYQAVLHAPIAVIHKMRTSGEDVTLRSVMGDVRNRAPLIVDDMISTAGTVVAAVNGLLAAGCRPHVSVAATHALMVGPAAPRLASLPINALVVSDSVVVGSGMPPATRIVSVAPLLAGAITSLHHDRSLDRVQVHR